MYKILEEVDQGVNIEFEHLGVKDGVHATRIKRNKSYECSTCSMYLYEAVKAGKWNGYHNKETSGVLYMKVTKDEIISSYICDCALDLAKDDDEFDPEIKEKEKITDDDKHCMKHSTTGNPFDIVLDRINKTEYFKKGQIPSRYRFDKFLIDYVILVVQAVMGSGKTYRIEELLDTKIKGTNVYKYDRVLVLTCRVSLADSLRARFKGRNIEFAMYNNPKEFNGKNEKLIAQCESMFKITGPYDLLIVDEYMTFARQLDSINTHKDNMSLNKARFESIVRDAKNIVLLDAFINSYDVDLYRKIRTKHGVETSIKCIKNTHVNNANIIIHKKLATFEAAMYKDFKDGVKLFVASTSKKYARKTDMTMNTLANKDHIDTSNVKASRNRIKRLIARNSSKLDKKIRLFTSDEKLKRTENINEICSNLDVLISTGTLGVGIDITNPFDKVYAIGNPYSGCPRDLLQLMGRCRNIETKEYHFFCPWVSQDDRGIILEEEYHNVVDDKGNVEEKKRCRYVPRNIYALKQYILSEVNVNNNTCRHLFGVEHFIKDNGYYKLFADSNDVFFDAFVSHKLEELKGWYNYRYEFIKLAECVGYEITWYVDPELEGIATHIEKLASDLLKREDQEIAQEASILNEADYLFVKAKLTSGQETIEDKASLKLTLISILANEDVVNELSIADKTKICKDDNIVEDLIKTRIELSRTPYQQFAKDIKKKDSRARSVHLDNIIAMQQVIDIKTSIDREEFTMGEESTRKKIVKLSKDLTPDIILNMNQKSTSSYVTKMFKEWNGTYPEAFGTRGGDRCQKYKIHHRLGEVFFTLANELRPMSTDYRFTDLLDIQHLADNLK